MTARSCLIKAARKKTIWRRMRFWNFLLTESTGNGLKKVTFSSWNKLNAEQRKSQDDRFCPAFFNFDAWKTPLGKCSAAQSIQPSSQSNLPPNYFWLFPSWQAIVMHMKKKRVYTKWCWWWFFNTIFCIHKISSQCYKMKLYKCSWIYHSHLRFRLTLRDIHRWFAKLERAANQRQEFIHESTPAETQAVLIRNCTNLKKHRRNRREQKNSTPFLKWSFRGHQHHLTKTQKTAIDQMAASQLVSCWFWGMRQCRQSAYERRGACKDHV